MPQAQPSLSSPCLKPSPFSSPCLKPMPSPCLKPSPSSSPCLKPMPSPCLKPMPQAHLFPLIPPYSNRIPGDSSFRTKFRGTLLSVPNSGGRRRRRRRLKTTGSLARSLPLTHPGVKYPVRGYPSLRYMLLLGAGGEGQGLGRPEFVMRRRRRVRISSILAVLRE